MPLRTRLERSLSLTHDGHDETVRLSVAAASHSFADEFVAQLAEDSEQGKVPFVVTVCGASTEVDRVVRQAPQRRDISLPALV